MKTVKKLIESNQQLRDQVYLLKLENKRLKTQIRKMGRHVNK